MFDLVVVTAANAAQSRGYREQVKWRRARGMLPAGLEVVVVGDPGGRRVGSLGATVNVLKRLGDVSGRKVFICHSGGDARRTPGYAAMGKAFTPLPVAGGGALFDLILANMAKLPMPKAGGVLVACGDVLITFDFAATDLSSPGVTGVGFYDTAERAARQLSQTEYRVYSILKEQGELPAEEICRQMEQHPSYVLPILSALELKGFITCAAGKFFLANP